MGEKAAQAKPENESQRQIDEKNLLRKVSRWYNHTVGRRWDKQVDPERKTRGHHKLAAKISDIFSKKDTSNDTSNGTSNATDDEPDASSNETSSERDEESGEPSE